MLTVTSQATNYAPQILLLVVLCFYLFSYCLSQMAEYKEGARKRKSDGSTVGYKKAKGKGSVASYRSTSGTSIIPISRLPMSVRPELKRAFNAEFWSAETLDDPTTGASLFSTFMDVSIGNTAQTRVGDAICAKVLKLNFLVNQAVDNTRSTFNIALVEDNQPAAATPGWTDVWAPATTLTGTMINVGNFDKRSRFRIRFQKEYVLRNNGDQQGTTTPDMKRFHVVVPINKIIKYDSSNGIYHGVKYHLFGWGTNSTNTPQAFASYEFFFTDA